MMHHNGSLAPTRGSAYTTTVAVALQDNLTEAAEVFLILPLECVTGRTEAMGENLVIPAPAIHCSLYTLQHLTYQSLNLEGWCLPVERISTRSRAPVSSSPVKLVDLSCMARLS